jgi:hypothetical protein
MPEEIKANGSPKVKKAFKSKFANISLADNSPSSKIRHLFPPKISHKGMMD